jgi:hypothetical protein
LAGVAGVLIAVETGVARVSGVFEISTVLAIAAIHDIHTGVGAAATATTSGGGKDAQDGEFKIKATYHGLSLLDHWADSHR